MVSDLFSGVLGEKRGSDTPDELHNEENALQYKEVEEDVITDYNPGDNEHPATYKRNGVPCTDWSGTDAEKAFSEDRKTANRRMTITNYFRNNQKGFRSSQFVYNLMIHRFEDEKECREDLDALVAQGVFEKQRKLASASVYNVKPIMDWPEMHRTRFGFWHAGGRPTGQLEGSVEC